MNILGYFFWSFFLCVSSNIYISEPSCQTITDVNIHRYFIKMNSIYVFWVVEFFVFC